jgi:ubiquinone biosynthesis protein UbiJ
MFSTLTNALGTAAMERITLLLNHVLRSEPVATARLAAHSGRSVQIVWTGWPSLLPAPPLVMFLVTPAGLLEWCEQAPSQEADLRLVIDASNPARMAAQWFAGQRPDVAIDGDAAFAADISWVTQNVRWDIQDDLARIVGAGPARELARVASAVVGGLASALRTLGGVASKMRRGDAASGRDAYDRNDASRFGP